MDEPSALARMPAPSADDADDYEAFCAAIMASARGRWFLQEFARRNRQAEIQQVLAAIGRIEAVIRERSGEPYQSFGGALREMAQFIADARSDAVEVPSDDLSGDSPAAPPADDAVAIAERIRSLVRSLRERGAAPAESEQIEALATTIQSAAVLRDPADRRARQLVEMLGHLERRVRAMLDATALEAQPEPAEDVQTVPADTASTPQPNDETPPARPAAVTTVAADETDPSVPRSSASLLEGLNAFAALGAGDAPLPAASLAADAPPTATVAPPPDVSPAAAPAVPLRGAESVQPPAEDAPLPQATHPYQPEAAVRMPALAPAAEPVRVHEPVDRAVAPSPAVVPVPPRPAPTVAQAARVPTARPPAARTDAPLAALMALSDEERIALFS